MLLLQILSNYSSAFSQSIALLHCNDATHDMYMSVWMVKKKKKGGDTLLQVSSQLIPVNLWCQVSC